VPLLTFCTSFKVKKSKVRVTKPLLVAAQVITCRERGHIVTAELGLYRPHSF